MQNIIKIILVTGVSGAGKTSVLKLLEDQGFEAIDNVPISLLNQLVSSGELPTNTAIGVDIRTRDFDTGTLLDTVDRLKQDGMSDVSILFVDCEDDVLIRRFAETRRRHPLSRDRPVPEGILQERKFMAPLRERATIVLDTSDMNPRDLRRFLQGQFSTTESGDLSVFVTSFGFKNGLPRNADLVFDVRFLKNPYYELDLRALSGRDKAVADYIKSDEGFSLFMTKLQDLLTFLLARYVAEGKSYLTIAIGCTGGHHRSVLTTEELGAWLEERHSTVHKSHRDLDKR